MYNGDEVIEEYASGSLTKSYILGEYIDQPIALILSPDAKRLTPEVYYYHSNARQSIMALTDKSGAIAESYSYNAYGTRRVTFSSSQKILQEYGYTGRRIDAETGLMYFRARYYSPELGRFISRAPLAFVDGMNLYAGYFAMHGMIDPMGLSMSPYTMNRVKTDKNYCYGDSSKALADEFKKQREEVESIEKKEFKELFEQSIKDARSLLAAYRTIKDPIDKETFAANSISYFLLKHSELKSWKVSQLGSDVAGRNAKIYGAKKIEVGVEFIKSEYKAYKSDFVITSKNARKNFLNILVHETLHDPAIFGFGHHKDDSLLKDFLGEVIPSTMDKEDSWDEELESGLKYLWEAAKKGDKVNKNCSD